MASYKKYAEDLIGNWETGQYEPQRTVTQDIYQTNINKLANDFGALKDKLARNFENAQREYANTMNAVQNQSFNRMRNANIDLANRGLSTSGVGNLITQADVQQKGEDVDKALGNLLDVNNAGVEGLTSGVMNLGQKQTALAGDLAGDLGGITDKEAANAQQYANLIAGLGNSAANRAASRRSSGGGGSTKKVKEQEEADELKRRRLIADTLSSNEISDTDKAIYLYQYLDVPLDTARAAVKGYNDNITLETTQNQLNNLQEQANRYNDAARTLSDFGNQNDLFYALSSIPNVYNDLALSSNRRRTEKLQKDIEDLSYTDLYELLYGKK